MKYEYKVIDIPDNKTDVEDTLNKWSVYGFKLSKYIWDARYIRLVLEKEAEVDK